MKRFLLPIACIAGLVAIYVLLPLFDPPLPRGISVTKAEAGVAADKAAREFGIDVDKAYRILVWQAATNLEGQFKADPELRRKADADPVVGPRFGNWFAIYHRKGQPKFPAYGWVALDRHGRVMGIRRTPGNEEAAPAASAEALRVRADEFVRSRALIGAPDPVFESDRPNVLLKRTDHTFRYSVPTAIPSGTIVYLVGVHFVGDKLSGWSLIEENRDGSPLAFEREFVGSFMARIVLLFGMLLVLLVIFLKKYHEGEVGIGVAGFLFALMIVLAILAGAATARESSFGTQLGSLDAPGTTWANFGFALLFVQLPLAVLVFLAWSVGESYTRERWGERLASFDAILRRDPINASVGRSLLAGALNAPAAAGLALAISAIPVVTGLATPGISVMPAAFAFGGSPWLSIIGSLSTAITIAVGSFLFVIGALRRRASRPLALVIAIGLGTVVSVTTPLTPEIWSYVFGFGLVTAAAAVFVFWDLLAATVTLFGATLMLELLPYARVAEGKAQLLPLVAAAIPLGLVLIVAGAGLLTRREIEYRYDDLAPHVRRIVERERVKAEIDAANRIQAALLPSCDPTIDGVTVSSHYRAATEIGGDYFDFLELGNERIGVAFGDVAGHGLTSGIVMAMAKAALLVQVEHDPSPVRVMEVLNNNVMKTAPPRMMMTFFFGILDPSRQTLRCSSAGHLDPYLYRVATGKLECLSSWGFPLGVKRREPFRELTVQFEPGDRLVLYSDGLIEAVDDRGEPFGFDRFERVLENSATQSAEEIKKAVLSSVKKFTNNRPPEDDQTLVVFSFEEVAAERKLA
ncbi:MAG: PP2C family protein-serine/threonine phosphatase [Thermoanaerobaculia bacterium]|jgi:hypothetical protein